MYRKTEKAEKISVRQSTLSGLNGINYIQDHVRQSFFSQLLSPKLTTVLVKIDMAGEEG